MSTDWTTRLITAVNGDNDDLDRRCSTATTRDLLAEAPTSLSGHAALALADFDLAGDAPLSQLRSDTVAAQFTVTVMPPAENLFVARMTVPGGPWPGHFGLEAILFTAFKVGFPAWFPAIETDYSLDFADFLAASNGFMRRQGAIFSPNFCLSGDGWSGSPSASSSWTG